MSDGDISAGSIEKQQTLLRTELKLPKIRTSNQELSEFTPKKIYDVYINEAGLDPETAEYYTQLIMADLNKLYIQNRLHEISTRMLRELMCAHAIQQGDFATRNKLSVLGLPIKDVENLFFSYNSENSNHVPSEEFIHKAMADVINEQYSFSTLYNFNTPWGNPAYAHMNADVYIHDRDYPGRPFCFQHSARFIFRNGLYIDGTGKHVNVSRPPKNLEVAIRQVCEFLGAASRNWNGGQSFRNLFWELGPYLEASAKNCSTTKNLGGVEIPTSIVQAAQMMRYEPNHILVGRGSQAAFSSLSNFAVPPKYLTEDSDIVLPGGQVIKGSYADYKEYVLKFWYAYLFESTRGDSNGGMFHWMKDDIGIKPAWFSDPELQQYVFEPLMKYVAKFGGPYVYNVKNVSDDEVACTSCCSLVLQSESPDDFDLARQGTLGMGALQCGSFNLPRIAYLAGGDDAKVYEMIESRMNLLAEVMKAKKAFMKKIIATGVAPFLTQPRLRGKDNTPYFDIEKQSYLMSFCGMNEFTKAHIGYELHESKDAHNYAMKLLMHMLNYSKKLSEETGLNMAIWRQPGETMPGKFAQDDYKKFNGKAVVQGNPKAGAAYYSNFTHVNVNSGLSVFDKVKNEAPFHALSPSNLLHVWLGEENPDPGALWDMTKKILDKSLTNYFAFTREITVCNNCKTSHSGVVSHCKCGAGPKDLVVNSRIVGYYSAVGTVESILNWRKNQSRESLKGAFWQPHKFAEFNNRTANYSGARLSQLGAN